MARKRQAATGSGTTPPGLRDPNLPVVRPEVRAYVLDFYVDGRGNMPARDWLRSLDTQRRFAAGHAMQAQLQQDGIGVCRTRWGKNLGGGLAEFRVSEPSEQGEVVLRVFFHAFGDRRILILHGYDKGEDPSAGRQQREITEAKRRLNDFDARMKAGSYPLRELPPTAAAADRARTSRKP